MANSNIKKRKERCFMKKFKKIIAMCLATVMALSVMCVGVSAKEVHHLKNGVTLTTYDDGEYTPRANMLRTVDASFNTTLAVFPSSTMIGNSLSLGSSEDEMEIVFTTRPVGMCYFSLYDMTADEYLTTGSNNMSGPSYMGSMFTLSGLTGGHKYRIRMSAAVQSCPVAGTITSY